ncbi:MAG: hypothetical protein U0X91_05750 [Spirosomataceae bacterium]
MPNFKITPFTSGFRSNNEGGFERIVREEKIFDKMPKNVFPLGKGKWQAIRKILMPSVPVSLCLFAVCLPPIVAAQPSVMTGDSLRKDLLGALRYLAETQCRQTTLSKEYAGEWPAYMQMHTRFVLLGTRHKYRDSNSFTTVGVHNLLSEMYLADTSLRQILPVLEDSYAEIRSYSEAGRFNFWKKLPPNRDLQKGDEPNPVPWVQRPTHYRLNSRYINNAANVENDADDTASGNLAIWYHNQIFRKNDSLISAALFDGYLDDNRRNRHWYNYLFNGCPESGAYLTWLGKEADFKRWNILKTIGHNQIFFLKSSICCPVPYQPYIPYGTNDVDAVVNANILTFLAHKGELVQSKGHSGAHTFIEHQAKYERWSRAGTYYPNRYHFHYAVSRALAAGDTALRRTAQQMLAHLVASQQKDGSYRSRRKVNHRDKVQSTAYALAALLNFSAAGLNVPSESIKSTVAFLVSQKQQEGETIYWKGGVFFSGGTVVRNVLYFTSEAYTTALIAFSLQKYLKISESDSRQTTNTKP